MDLRILSELGNCVSGVFTPVLAKHSKNFSIVDSLAIGVDRIQRNFDPLRQQVETCRSHEMSDEQASWSSIEHSSKAT
jgi:hypothetical protein